MRTVVALLLGPALAAAFYMVLIDTVDLPELYAAIGAVLLSAGAYEAARRQRFAEASVRLAWLARGWRVAASVPRHVAVVSWEAFAQLGRPAARRGQFRAVPFRHVGDGSEDFGRRALAEALGSLAPNTIVLGVDTDSGLLLVHQLHQSGGREELDPLELG